MSQANKITVERNQRALLELVNQPGNDACADCKTRNPRWASHNLGIFICVNCASIHRKIGTHVTKVKSLTLDSWTKEQVEHMRQNGNIKSNAYYNPDERRHPPPTNMIDSERDSELEKYIRAKYEFKSFLDRRSKVAALLGPSQSAASRQSVAPPVRSQTVPVPETKSSTVSVTPPPPVPEKTVVLAPSSTLTQSTLNITPASTSLQTQTQPRSVSQPIATPSASYTQQQQVSATQATSSYPSYINATLPLQYAQPSSLPPTSQPMSIPNATISSHLSVSNPYSGLSVNAGSPLPSTSPSQLSSTGISPGTMGRSMSLNTGLSLGMNNAFASGLSANPGQLSTQSFEPQSMQNVAGLSAQPMFTPSASPSPNQFAPQALSTTPSMGMTGQLSMGGLQPQNSLSPFSSSPFQPQQHAQQQPQLFAQQSPSTPQPHPAPSPFFQPQLHGQSPAPPQMQGNPFLQQMQPQFTAQPQFMSAPSAYGQQQPQQQPQTFHSSNPFGGWQQGQQGLQPQQGFQPQQTGFQPQQTGFQPQQTGFQPQQTGFQPQQTGFQGQQWGGF
ncbi:ArfGap-domain-containing protein [Obba rivulosa]|uniref:ArfGap-domain-containing protein n=1 Tax=Obba rivulosa TaxID=1052685 RepID=A0A8E2APG8_9APHY|nr:ArfGap-domain-containing protein [Obba rivulosa]